MTLTINRTIVFVLTASVFSACGGQSENRPGNTATTTSAITGDTVAVSWSMLEADSVKTGDVLMIDGYIGDIGTYVKQVNGSITVPLFPRRNQRAGFRLNLNVKVGNGPNQAQELPAEFLPEDFKVFDAYGEGYITTGAHVSIKAVKRETIDGLITADLVEIFATKTPGFIATGGMPDSMQYVTALTSEIIHDTAQTSVYCYLEGNLELPEIILPYTREVTLDLKNSSVPEIKTMEIPLGTGPGTMNDLPDNYTEADLVIRDHHASPVKYGAKVRLYGTWERFAFESGFPGKFYLEEIEVIRD